MNYHSLWFSKAPPSPSLSLSLSSMEIPKMTSMPLIFVLVLALIRGSYSGKGNIAIYWGQNGPTGTEGTLEETCNTGKYAFVNLAFLYKFGGGQAPGLNLDNHCNSDCKHLESEIKACQSQGILVFLSIGGGGNYSLTSEDDANQVGEYLWSNFLSGNASGPLGAVFLNGIDFFIEAGTADHYDVLARYLKFKTGHKVFLTASPMCFYPDHYLNTALQTGLFDYVWVQFYDNSPCQYSGNADNLIRSWNEDWIANFKDLVSQIFLGLPAAPGAAPSGGFIECATLLSEVLPAINVSQKYGGVMLWDRYYDRITNYSTCILPGV